MPAGIQPGRQLASASMDSQHLYTSTLTIGSTGAAAAGNYVIDIVGVAPTSTHTTTVQLNLYEDLTVAPTLVSPANGASDVPIQPTFTWDAVTGSTAYTIEIATDVNFSNIVDAATVSGTSYTPATPLDGSTFYFWRVTASNVCGSSTPSSTFLFITVEFNLSATSPPSPSPTVAPGHPTLNHQCERVWQLPARCERASARPVAHLAG
ncbi:MAG: hypothetical protein R3E31_06690 [Chloroflexota bacterium]